MRINDILIKPYITEKAMSQAKNSVYVFEVAKRASKDQVRKVIQELFKVEVGTVSTATRKGKIRRVGKRARPKQQPNKKIAYVKITKGTIDIFPKA